MEEEEIRLKTLVERRGKRVAIHDDDQILLVLDKKDRDNVLAAITYLWKTSLGVLRVQFHCLLSDHFNMVECTGAGCGGGRTWTGEVCKVCRDTGLQERPYLENRDGTKSWAYPCRDCGGLGSIDPEKLDPKTLVCPGCKERRAELVG